MTLFTGLWHTASFWNKLLPSLATLRAGLHVPTDECKSKQLLLSDEISVYIPKGVFNLSNQLSNFSKNWEMQHDKTEFHKFHRLISPHFCYSPSKIAIVLTISIGKHVVKSFEISLETTISEN